MKEYYVVKRRHSSKEIRYWTTTMYSRNDTAIGRVQAENIGEASKLLEGVIDTLLGTLIDSPDYNPVS